MSLKVLLRCSDEEFEKLISLMDLEVSYFKGTRRLTTQPSTPATRSSPRIEGRGLCHTLPPSKLVLSTALIGSSPSSFFPLGFRVILCVLGCLVNIMADHCWLFYWHMYSAMYGLFPRAIWPLIRFTYPVIRNTCAALPHSSLCEIFKWIRLFLAFRLYIHRHQFTNWIMWPNHLNWVPLLWTCPYSPLPNSKRLMAQLERVLIAVRKSWYVMNLLLWPLPKQLVSLLKYPTETKKALIEIDTILLIYVTDLM